MEGSDPLQLLRGIMANLVTIQQYKDFAGITGVGQDAKLNVIIPSISQVVKTYCGTSFIDYYSADKVEYFNISDRETTAIMVDESPLVSVSEVQERQSQADSYVTLITENSDGSGKYEHIVDTDLDTIFRTTDTADKAFPMGRRAVKVTYRSGYSATPQDLKLACFDLIKYYLKDERKSGMTISGAQVRNEVSTSLRENIGFPDHIKRILDFYKVHK